MTALRLSSCVWKNADILLHHHNPANKQIRGCSSLARIWQEKREGWVLDIENITHRFMCFIKTWPWKNWVTVLYLRCLLTTLSKQCACANTLIHITRETNLLFLSWSSPHQLEVRLATITTQLMKFPHHSVNNLTDEDTVIVIIVQCSGFRATGKLDCGYPLLKKDRKTFNDHWNKSTINRKLLEIN